MEPRYGDNLQPAPPPGDPGPAHDGLHLPHLPHLSVAMLHPHRPSLRGMNHLIAFPLALVASIALVWWAQGRRADLAAFAFGASITGVFGMSAAFHRIHWPQGWARWARRADHSMIFVAMAGIYTSAWLAVLDGTLADTLLAVSWCGAAAGVVLKLVWIDAPRAVAAATYNAFGLTGLLVVPQLWHAVGPLPTSLLLLGGLLFLAGGVVYTLEWPDPIPDHFGFHEVFHMLVTLGIGIFYAVMAIYLIPH